MRGRNRALGPVVAAAAALVLVGATAQAAEPPSEAPAVEATVEAPAVEGPGYVVVGPSSDGGFIPTGPLDPDTLVVVLDDDGTLPGGLTVAELEALVQARADGDVAAIEAAGFSLGHAASETAP